MRILLGLVFSVLVGPASAAWLPFFSNETETWYYDSDLIAISGDRRRAWVLVDSYTANALGARSMLSRDEYDCSEGRFRTHQLAPFFSNMGKGAPISEWKYDPPTEWFLVSPGGASAVLFKVLCKKLG
jgi:hypothetical protein